MTTPQPSMDIESLLRPISEQAPCGDDLSFSPAFDQITLARREDDPTLDQGEWVTSLKTADWPLVVQRCTTLLQTETKDIRLAVWLAEALGKTRGFAGLGDGFKLLEQLCERYWGGLHPLPDGDDQEQRVGNVAWLVQRSAILLKQLPLTAGAAGYGYNDFLSAQALQTQLERDPDNATTMADGKVTLAMFQLAVSNSRRSFYEALLRDVLALRDAFTALCQRIDALLGADAPSYRSAQSALDDVVALAERNARQLGVGGAAPPPTPVTARADVDSSASGQSGPIVSRSQALQQLRLVADYFRRTEPHSPVAYLADKAATWGDMPLHAWLRAVVKDGGSLAQLEEILGVEREAVRPESDES